MGEAKRRGTFEERKAKALVNKIIGARYKGEYVCKDCEKKWIYGHDRIARPTLCTDCNGSNIVVGPIGSLNEEEILGEKR